MVSLEKPRTISAKQVVRPVTFADITGIRCPASARTVCGEHRVSVELRGRRAASLQCHGSTHAAHPLFAQIVLSR